MRNELQLWKVLRNSVLITPLLFLLLYSTSLGQLSGTKYIGGTSPDYATIKEAILDLNTQGVTSPGVTFLIRDGVYNEDSLSISTATSSDVAPIVFAPDAGATVTINVTPPNSTYDFGIAIIQTQYVTIDGSNNGTTTRDLTINSLGATGEKGIWISGASFHTTIKNCNVNAAQDIATPTSSHICIDLRYTGALANPSYTVIENNYLKYAYTGIRLEGNTTGDVVESAVLRNNIIDSVANSGIYTWYQNGTYIYGNDMNVLRGSSATIYGLYVGGTSSNVKVFQNKIHDINQLSTSSSSTYAVYISTSSTLGMISFYNNFIYNVMVTPTGTGAVYGIYHSTANSTVPDTIAYNSVNLTGTSDGNRSTTAYYKASSTGPTFVYNNIFQNTRLDGTTGQASAIGITTSSVNIMSNNNNLYVGTPDAQHSTGRIGTTYYATLGDWQVATGTDANSVVENAPFVSADDLHIQTNVPTQLESAGTPIAGITDDIDGDIRNAVTPDIGADEGNFPPLDLTPPDISYTPLGNSSSTTTVTLDATITDLSGVQTGTNGPRLYYKKSTDVSYVFDENPVIAVDNYTFTIDYTNLGGVAIGDTIHYYVAAQDIYANAGTNPVGGSGSNPPGTVPPDPDNYYVVVGAPLSGTYTVGLSAFSKAIGKNVYTETLYRTVTENLRNSPDSYVDINGIEQADKDGNKNLNHGIPNTLTKQEPYTVLMANGKPLLGTFYQTDDGRGIYPTITAAVNDLNLRGIDGPVTFLLVDTDYPSETYPILVGEIAGSSETNTITFKPGPGIVTQIPGAIDQPTSTFQLGGADYVIIDGSNTAGGTSQDLTINALNASPAFHFYGGSDYNIVKNTIFSSLNTSTGSGTFLFGASNSGDYNIVENCNVKSNDTSATKQAIGIYMFSSNTSTGNQILNCNVTAFESYGIYLRGAPSFDHIVRGNTVALDVPSAASTVAGMRIDGAAGTLVDANYFLNINSTYSSPSVYGIYYYGSSITMNVIIQNNVISVGDLTPAGTIRGLDYWGYTPNSVEMYFNTVYIGGTDVTGGSSYGMTKRAGNDTYKAYDNVIYNARSNGTGTGSHYGVYMSTTTVTTFELNNNDYYLDGSGAVLGYYGTTTCATLADWQTASGQDANSLNADPLFVSATDLRPSASSPLLNAGTPIAGITTDILGVVRNVTTPTIGAYEEAVILPLSGVYTVGLSAFKQATGKEVYFKTVTSKVRVDLSKPDSYRDLTPEQKKSLEKEISNDRSSKIIEVTRTSKVLMENGKPFNRDFYKSKESRGVYPTITEAVNDLNLRGVSGPVTFLLVDSDYPNETYPILVGEFAGSSPTNTVTFKPADGVVTQIPGAVDQPTSTFQLGGADNVIIDGSNTAGGTTQDLTINALTTTAPAFHFYGGSDNNIVKNTIFTSLNTSTGSGTFLFGASASGDNNVVENCSVKANDTSATRYAVGVYMFSSNTSTGNQVLNCNVTGFASYGIYLRGAPSFNHIVRGNTVDMLTPSTASTVAGIRLDGAAGTLVDANYFLNLNSSYSSPSVYGIYYYGYSTTMDIIIQNNVVSLGDLTAAGTIRGLDYYAYSVCSVEFYFNTVFIGGTAVTGGSSYGLTQRIGADTYKAYDNAIYNSRSNGAGAGVHYGVYISSTSTTTFALNNNDYYTDGAGGVLGYYSGTTCTTLAEWQTASSQDANSLNSDPQFISNTDFRPATTSPLIGAGLTIAGIGNDIIGDPRNEPPTIGAYENGVVVALAAPSDLTAEGDTNIVYLQWVDNSNNELGFVIERRLGDTTSVNPFEVIDTVAANSQDYMDLNVAPQTTYTYRLYAYNSEGVSGYSNIAQATTPVPVELSSFTANIGDNSVTVNWSTATETNNSGFELQRKIKDNWERVTFIKGKGTTTEKSEYSYTDDFKYQSVSGVITYRLKQVDLNGTFNYSNQINVTVDFTPKEYTLYQNYPNPFNPTTKIKFALPFDSRVKISVYNILGELIDVILDEVRTVGYHDVQFNGLNMASGMYIYTIQAKSVDGKKDFSSVKKMMLVK